MYRKEYPRPQFVREEWMNLNGKWDFTFDDTEQGMLEKWYEENNGNFGLEIEVPFAFQSELSGIDIKEFHDTVWYQRKFSISNEWKNKKIILHFGAVDYLAKVYLNGTYLGEHRGGHTPFSFDITPHIKGGEERLTVYVNDPSTDERIPRGKQYWHEEARAIWYPRTTGIWQTVWLEAISSTANILPPRFTPRFSEGQIEIDYRFSGEYIGKKLLTEISYQGKKIIEESSIINEETLRKSYYLQNNQVDRGDYHGVGWTWTPEQPNLYDIRLTLLEENLILDEITSYFGMREIKTRDGMTLLNNRPYYQKLVLDQGYWPSSLMTAPSDEDFIRDIEMAKKMGFNGCRKHQKVEDPRFLYWADKLGFLVWGECASPSVYSNETVSYLTNEWLEIIERDYNHPSIVTWVPINESWGVPEISMSNVQQEFSLAIYHLIRSLDSTRLVISNDGWEMTKTDICAIHSYIHGNKDELKMIEYFKKKLSTEEELLQSEPNRRRLYCEGYEYQGEPILLTEFGGINYQKDENKGWGYSNAKSEEEFLEQYDRIMKAIYESEKLFGFCYTQLTDVEQEQNGLLTYDRQEKCELDKILKINNQWHRPSIKK